MPLDSATRHGRGPTIILAAALGGLMLAPVVSAAADTPRQGMGYAWCYDPKDPYNPAKIDCDKLPPAELAKQRAATDALKRRYDEQEALVVPPTKADLTLLCGPYNGRKSTVQIWFGAGLLTWGVGSDRQIWPLDRVSPTEITFTHVWPPFVVSHVVRGSDDYEKVNGHIDRVTGDYARDYMDEKGDCQPAQPKF